MSLYQTRCSYLKFTCDFRFVILSFKKHALHHKSRSYKKFNYLTEFSLTESRDYDFFYR